MTTKSRRVSCHRVRGARRPGTWTDDCRAPNGKAKCALIDPELYTCIAAHTEYLTAMWVSVYN